jgi:toxin ParE1/3/4
MTGYLLSPAAQADPAEIWSYSFENWGAAQADRYVNGIRDACAELTGNPTRGRAVDDIRPGYRKLAVGSHVLFYRVADSGLIDVIRILHRRMDAEGRLGARLT